MSGPSLVEALGWALVHFLWQGVLVVALLGVSLRVLKSAELRYLAATSAMVLLLVVATVTFVNRLDWRDQGATITTPIAGPVDRAYAAVDRSSAGAGSEVDAATQTVTPAITSLRSDTEIDAETPPAVAGELREASSAWLGWVVMGWLVGVVLFGLRFFLDWRAVLSLKDAARSLEADSEWSQRFSRLAQRMGITHAVQLLTSAEVTVPVVLGVLRPVVIVPAAMLSGLPPAQVDALLLHELAHVRRHDFLVNLLQSLVETVFFFHPAVWWISRRIREERENCCDDLASSHCGDVREYAGALAALEESREMAAPTLSLAANGPGSNGGSLVGRIRRLVRREGPSAPAASAVWPLASVVTLVLALAGIFSALSLIAEGLADDDVTTNWKSLRVSHFGDGDREVFCIHTDEAIQTVVVMQTPAEYLSSHSDAGVRKVKKGGNHHLAYGNFGWGDVRVKIGFDSARPERLRINEQTVLLEHGRVVFWRTAEMWADQSTVLAADLPQPSQPESELGKTLGQLRERIVGEFAPKDAANILAPSRPGTWSLGQGVTLDVEQREIDGAEEGEKVRLTRAIVRWPATESLPALRHEIDFEPGPWALALEKNGRTIWTAGDHEVFRRIEFSDPMRIQEDCMNAGFGDMPEGVRAELQREIRVNKKLDRGGLMNIGGNMGSHGESAALIEEEFVVRGSVIDEQPGWPNRQLPAAPFADVLVEAYTIASPNLPVAKTRSDAEGNWELRFRVEADLFEKVSRRLEIRADVPGYAERDLMAEGEMILAFPDETVEGINDEARLLRAGGEGQVTFRMLKAGKISGVLRDGEGKPIADAFVWVKVDDDEEPWDDEWVARPGVVGDQARSSEKGEFVLSRVPPNRELHIAASLPGSPPVQTDAYMMGDAEMTLNVTWDGDTLECSPDDGTPRTGKGDAQAAGHDEDRDESMKEEIIVTLKADGGVVLDGEQVTTKQLQMSLKDHAETHADRAVVIRASQETEFGAVTEVLDRVKQAGLWNVAFATIPEDATRQDTPVEVDGGHQDEWSAEGRVTDIRGRPMEGVEVVVYSGMGSLRRTGVARSGADGRYRVTFSRGGLMSVDSPNLQVAQIGAHFPGYVEKNLNRHGNGAMAMGSEGADSAIVWSDFDNDGQLDLLLGNFEISDDTLKSFGVDADSLALPGRPRKLDFVMVPAVRIEGQLVGTGAFSGASARSRSDHESRSSSGAVHRARRVAPVRLEGLADG